MSDREKADFIFDLAHGVPDDLLGRFDFIYNGSVLDNVFDPATCIRNVARMLKPNGVTFGYGRIGAFGCGIPQILSGVVLRFLRNSMALPVAKSSRPPTTTSIKKLSMSSAGARSQRTGLHSRSRSQTMPWWWHGPENSPSATWDRTPIQGVYRDEDHETAHKIAFGKYVEHPRRTYLNQHFGARPLTRPAKELARPAWAEENVEHYEIENGNRYLGKTGG